MVLPQRANYPAGRLRQVKEIKKMRKIIFVIWFLVIPLFWMRPGIYAQEDMERIDNAVFQKPARPMSVFPHDTHNEKAEIEDCNTCHHVYVQGKRIEDESSEDQRCSECHLLQKQGKTPALMRAFHLNCKKCHLSRKSGPVMCGECHSKAASE